MQDKIIYEKITATENKTSESLPNEDDHRGFRSKGMWQRNIHLEQVRVWNMFLKNTSLCHLYRCVQLARWNRSEKL